MKPIKPLYVFIIAIVIAAVGFYCGVVYQKNQTRASFANGAGFAGRFGGQAGAGGFGQRNGGQAMAPVRGQIVSIGDNTVTVKLQDGSSKIVDLTSQTNISKTTTGSATDLKTGQMVTALGTTNSDGSVTAQTVLIGNGMMMFRGQRNGGTLPASQ